MEKHKKIYYTILVFLVILWFGSALIQLIIGGLYYGKCPIQPKIPIFNIVAGIIGFIITVIIILCVVGLIYIRKTAFDDDGWGFLLYAIRPILYPCIVVFMVREECIHL